MKKIAVLLTPNGLRFVRFEFDENGAFILSLDMSFIVIGVTDAETLVPFGYALKDVSDVPDVTDYQRYICTLWTSQLGSSDRFLESFPPSARDFIQAFTDVYLLQN